MVLRLICGPAPPDKSEQGQPAAPNLVGFQEVAKFTDGRVIQYGLSAQINADELSHCPRVTEGLLHRLDRLNQNCRKWVRSIWSTPTSRRPTPLVL